MKTDFDDLFLYCPSDSEVFHSCCFEYKSTMHRTVTPQKFLYLQPDASFGSLCPCLPARNSGVWQQEKRELNNLLALLLFFKEQKSQLLGLHAAPVLMRCCSLALGQDQAGQWVIQEQGRGNKGRQTISLSPFHLSCWLVGPKPDTSFVLKNKPTFFCQENLPHVKTNSSSYLRLTLTRKYFIT